MNLTLLDNEFTFFSIFCCFNEALPQIAAPTQLVMAVVRQLSGFMKGDLFLHDLYQSFELFCAADVERSRTALKIALLSPLDLDFTAAFDCFWGKNAIHRVRSNCNRIGFCAR